MLAQARSIAAAACAPSTAGKNPNLALHAVGTYSTTVDPAYHVNIAPLKKWASVWWEKWIAKEYLTSAFQSICTRWGLSMGASWRRVTGPTAALVATLRRLKWHSVDGQHLGDDIGGQWDVGLDPPADIEAATKQSADRWTLDANLAELPAARPDELDVRPDSPFVYQGSARGVDSATFTDSPEHPFMRKWLTVSAAAGIRPLLLGAKTLKKQFPRWTTPCRSHLISAISGGQWPQARKAKLAAFEGADRYQLCHEEAGTLHGSCQCCSRRL